MHIRTDFRNGVRSLRNRDKIQRRPGTEEDKCQMVLDYCGKKKKFAYMMGELHNQKALFSGVSIFCLAFLLLSMNTYFAHHFEFQFVCEVVKCLEKGQLIFSLGQRDRREETGK